MYKPEISIILPFYNAEFTIGRAIQSIIDQTYTSWELLLVNNGSTEHSTEIARSFARRDSRIRLLNEECQGVVFAFNAGLTQSQGLYIARMDADDYSYPSRLEKQLHYLKNHPEVAAVSGQVKYCANATQKGMQRYVSWVNSLTTSEQIMNNRFVELPTINPSLMFRRTDLEKYGSYVAGDFPEDYELILRWLDQGAVLAKIEDTVLDWYDHPDRLTRTDPRYSTEAFYRLKTRYLARWLKRYNLFHPKVVVWGGGRKSRQRSNMLEAEGIEISAYIDIIPDKTSRKPCIFYRNIAPPGEYFILSYVGNRGQREEIRQFLLSLGYHESVDFQLSA